MSRKLFKSTAVVSSMTLLSRILGFVRDIIIARLFGAGFAADAFFVAFRIPNFMRRLFAEGAFNQAFVPVLTEYKEQQAPAEVKDLIDSITGVLGAILSLVTIIGVLAAPWLVYAFAPGFADDPQRYELTVSLLRLTFPYLLFISLTALAGSILNSYGRFAVPAFTPVLLNLSLIACALLLAPAMNEPVMALAIGVFVAGLVQLAFQLPFLSRLELMPRPRLRRRNPGVGRILKLMVPALIGSSVAQVNLLFDTLIASFLTAGSVSWLYYSDRLVEFPLGILGITLGTVILPRLSRQQARLHHEDFSLTLDWGMRLVVLVGLPSALGLGLLAGPILSTLFQYGEFSAHDADMAARSLLAYSLGLPAFLLIKILAPGFYSRQDTRTPVRIAVTSMIANMVLNVLLVFPLAHAGLALATSLSAFLNAALLYRGLRKAGVYQPAPEWGRFWARILIANGAMAAVLLAVTPATTQWAEWGVISRATHIGLVICAALLTYILILLVVGIRPHHLAAGKSSA